MLIHKGKLVNPQMSLASQGFIHNSSAFMVTKGIDEEKIIQLHLLNQIIRLIILPSAL